MIVKGDFEFDPGEHVTITAYDLHVPGRVRECIWTGSEEIYDVEYAIDGQIRGGRFYTDEIASAEK